MPGNAERTLSSPRMSAGLTAARTGRSLSPRARLYFRPAGGRRAIGEPRGTRARIKAAPLRPSLIYFWKAFDAPAPGRGANFPIIERTAAPCNCLELGGNIFRRLKSRAPIGQ